MRYSVGFIISWPFLYIGALFCKWLAPWFRSTRDQGQHPWVIGGHRGRIYADNAAALHAYIATQTDTPILWISMHPKLTEKLRAQGHRVLRKNSFAARLAILRAPVLIYSHGEDDLDTFLKLWRGTLGMRAYLGHSFNHLKKGQMGRPGLEKMSPRELRHYIYHIVRFDVLLSSSPLEKKHLEECFHGIPGLILPHGGAAHMDDIVAAAQSSTLRDTLVWFPTWRDTPSQAQVLDQMIAHITRHPRLHAFLAKSNLQLAIVGHINSGAQPASPAPHPRIAFYPPAQITALLSRAACFISDYSGLIFDWLYFGRPIIHFPFDEAQYLSTRNLCIPLDSLQFGPMAYSADALLDILESDGWKHLDTHRLRREHWMREVFPDPRPGFAQRCYQTIVNMRARFSEHNRTFTTEEKA